MVIHASREAGSLLCHLIGGLESPDSGEIVLCGKALTGLGERETAWLRAHLVGYGGWDSTLWEGCSVLENLVLPLALRGIPKEAGNRRGKDLLTQLGLSHLAHSYPKALSLAERRGILLGRAAAAAEPKLLLLNDLWTGLSRAAAEQLSKRVNHLHHTMGFALLTVTSGELPQLERDTDLTLAWGTLRRKEP